MRRTYHQVEGKLVEGPAPSRAAYQKSGLYVIPDIKPYKIPGTDRYITSRSQHRRYLIERGAVEVGNEKAAFFAQGVPQGPTKAEMETDIREAIEQCRAGKAAKGAEVDPQIAPHMDLTIKKD